jgi:type I restriction enzyme S subunit
MSMRSTSRAHTNRETRTYERAYSIVFRKTKEAFGGLSNMAGGFPLNVNGVRIRTSEALYQACRFPHLPEVQREIIVQRSPMTAKMKGKPHRADSRSDWVQVQVRVMRWCLRVKLAQNWNSFSELLLETGEHPIVEESPRDAFWGAKPVDGHKLVGMNVLGRLLMELREEVKRRDRASLLRVEPLGISNFRLYGRQIQAVEVEPLPEHTKRAARVERAGPRRTPAVVEVQASLFGQTSLNAETEPWRNTVREPGVSVAHLKPYPAMKESGVPCLGQVPEHWKVRKLRGMLRAVTERNRADLPLLSVVRERGVILRDVTNKDENPNFIPDDLTNYKEVRQGQFAMNKMKAWQGSYGISRHHGIVSPAYFVFDVFGVARDFFHSAIRSKAYVPFFKQASDGVRIGQWDLSPARMREIPFCVPSVPEQASIVRYLNYIDRRVRRYVRAKQRLIELLEEQKQAIIHRAVTRGLNPDVPLKPSRVEWLGDVPEHWQALRAKFAFDCVDVRSTTGEEQLLTVSSSDGVVPREGRNITMFKAASYVGHKLCWRKDLVINSLWAWANGLGFSDGHGLVSTAYGVYRLRKPYAGLWRYLDLALRSGAYQWQFQVRSKGIWKSRLQLTDSSFLDMLLVLPPEAEANAICDFVEMETHALGQVISSTRGKIELVREYYTRLIAEVVTGRVDVREAAANLPDEPDEPESLDDIDDLAGESDAVDAIAEEPET